ncbi:AMP-binding protein [Gordonia shandongensis]|uniref:AMP-binding protein n=1 Tax=Gordonia shandongensis TaxID=376351 RepID=UPI000427DDCA|nr:AMP-binding protein [Gordonia shandongensis]
MSPAPAVTDARTVAELLAPLADVTDRGLHFGDRFVSWRDHIAEARRRSAALRDRLDPDRPPHVGVLLPNVPEFSFLFCAAALGGFVLVGLNDTRRGDALLADVRRSDCQLVLASRAAGDALAGSPVPVVDVDGPEWAAMIDREAAVDARADAVAPDDLLMLIFTSGTTGDPKAVQCSQRKFAAPGVMLADRFGLGADDVAHISMPMFHSNALIAGWSVAAAAGASFVLREKFSASGFGDDVRRYGVTYANYVGKPLHYILATPERPDDAELGLRIMYGNEASAADRAEFLRRFGARVVDGYGSTEAGVSVTRTPDTPDAALGPLRDPVAVVDPDTLEPVPPGTVGEIVNTSGPGLFDGYYGDDAATAERMRGGVYRTGDLGWVDDEGYLYFAGRTGDWLRVDGENLGTRPIEQILLRHPAIDEVAVFGVPVDIGDEVGAALVVSEPAVSDPAVSEPAVSEPAVSGLDRAAFEAFLDAQPDLGVKQRPTRVWVVDALPQTATFKTARAALSASLGAPTWTSPR